MTHAPDRSRQLIAGSSEERLAVVDTFFTTVQQLRADDIDISGTFAWPFTGRAPATDQLQENTVEVYQRIVSSGLL